MAAPITTFVNEGDTIDYTPGSAVLEGAVVVQEEMVGVAVRAIAAGALGALRVKGVLDFPKTAATAYTAGKLAYWDAADQDAQEDSDTGTNKLIGKVVTDAAEADATVRIRMDQ